MTEEMKHKRVLWYTRRDGVVRGPYPEKQVSRYILLGRIRHDDEVRPEGGEWATLEMRAELVPEVMKLPPTEENLQKLMIARLHEDERQPRDRREGEGDVPADIRERRTGVERRRPEPPDVVRYRELKYQVSHSTGRKNNLYRYPLTLVAVLVVGFLASFVIQRGQPEETPPDCGAPPRPGVNWNGCNLSGMSSSDANLVGAHMRNARMDAADLSGARLEGADMNYASISLARLSNADLTHASLVGVAASGADLRNVRLTDADLSYANLSDSRLDGADLSGANLSNAIWVDRKPCLKGSIGACLRAR